jgi:hypothetical protein
MAMCKEMYEVELANLMLHREIVESNYQEKLQHL